jgi:hypothetical protein
MSSSTGIKLIAPIKTKVVYTDRQAQIALRVASEEGAPVIIIRHTGDVADVTVHLETGGYQWNAELAGAGILEDSTEKAIGESAGTARGAWTTTAGRDTFSVSRFPSRMATAIAIALSSTINTSRGLVETPGGQYVRVSAEA